jgi:integrase
MHAALSVLFRWLQQHRRVANNPCVGIWHPGPPPARDRVLSDAEIKKFWIAVDKIGGPYGAAFKVLLLTGARFAEVVGMHREEVGSDGVWTIPGERTKNHRPHTLPLPPLARQIIDSLPVVEGSYVFTLNGKKPINGFSRMKATIDEQLSELPRWVLHDLRRTAASGMQRLGIGDAVIERALNHISGVYRGVAGTYQRDPLTNEVRAALLRWSKHVDALVSSETADKVVRLDKRRR